MSLIDQIVDYGWQQGFGCVRLDDGTRLHLWSPLWPDTDPQLIHSHSYHFRSTIMLGEMISPQYRVEINPEGKRGCVIGTVTEEKLQNPTKVDLIELEPLHAKVGDTYEFGGRDRFHVTTCERMVMTQFEVLPIPAVKGAGFIIPLLKFKPMTERPSPAVFKAEVLRLLEEHNL
jgi:hypothetical protein